MAMQDDLGAPQVAGAPKARPRSVAAVVGGITALAWAVISAPLLLTMPTNEAGAILAYAIVFTVLPVAAAVGFVELVLVWRGGRTALAIVAAFAATIGCAVAVPMLIGSLRDLSAFLGEGGSTYGAERVVVVATTLAAVSAFQLLVAVLLLRGRWRLVPPLVVTGALALAWGPLLLPPPAASCPSVATVDLPGRIVVVGNGRGRGEDLPPGAICIATLREGRATLVFAPSAEDIAAEREWVNYPAFAPDGQRLAFNWEGRVVIMRVDGSALTDVGPGVVELAQPAWAPDGTALAVVVNRRVVATLQVADGSMSEIAEVEEPLNSHAFPRWSPIADEILVGVAVPYPDTESVVRLAMDGSGTRLEPGLQADWSPDGSRIAFVRRGPQVLGVAQTHRVMVMDADGGNVRELGGTPEHQEGPVWSPDGKWIAYAGYELDWGLYVQPVAGGPAQRIAIGLASYSIDWAP